MPSFNLNGGHTIIIYSRIPIPVEREQSQKKKKKKTAKVKLAPPTNNNHHFHRSQVLTKITQQGVQNERAEKEQSREQRTPIIFLQNINRYQLLYIFGFFTIRPMHLHQ